MKIHYQVNVAMFTCYSGKIIPFCEVILADNIVHPYPSIHLVVSENEGGYVAER
jgi:hypothetical protein